MLKTVQRRIPTQAEIDATYYFQEKFRSLRRAEKAGS